MPTLNTGTRPVQGAGRIGQRRRPLVVEKNNNTENDENKFLGQQQDKYAALELELLRGMEKFGVKREPFLDETTKLIEAPVGTSKVVEKGNAGPPLKFDEDDILEEDIPYKAAKDGIYRGCEVEVIREVKKASFRRDVRKGERGIVHDVSDTGVTVAFAGERSGIRMPRATLKRWIAPPQPQAAKKQKGVANPTEKEKEDKSLISWGPTELDDHALNLKAHIRSLLLQLVCSVGPKVHEIGFKDAMGIPIALRVF